ncbi:MAG TPA: hypothetical protein V6C95_24395 [Coleofasciculaceae cyanobacterium]
MEEFVSHSNATPNLANTTAEPPPNRERLKMILVSSPRVVKNTIHSLYLLGFAEVTEWSPLQPTPNPNEVMSVLSRNVTFNG